MSSEEVTSIANGVEEAQRICGMTCEGEVRKLMAGSGRFIVLFLSFIAQYCVGKVLTVWLDPLQDSIVPAWRLRLCSSRTGSLLERI